MLVDPSTFAVGSTVTGAIRQASQVTGTSFNYLLATAQVESGLNPRAGASTSSARGLFQFIDQTWLATMKQAGPALGYGNYAAAISKNASGRYEVTNPFMRAEILKLRGDPTANAVMAGAFTQANAAALNERLGRAPSEGELYIAHFLGAGGAAQLITLAANSPNAKAADFFPGAAQANNSIFYDRSTGAARGAAQVRDILTARYDVAARPQSGRPVRAAQAATMPDVGPLASAAGTVPVPAAAASAATPDTAGMTNAFAAGQKVRPGVDPDVFHGLFQDPGRTTPLAPVVSALWGVPDTAPGGNGASPAPAAMLDLFKDSGRNS